MHSLAQDRDFHSRMLQEAVAHHLHYIAHHHTTLTHNHLLVRTLAGPQRHAQDHEPHAGHGMAVVAHAPRSARGCRTRHPPHDEPAARGCAGVVACIRQRPAIRQGGFKGGAFVCVQHVLAVVILLSVGIYLEIHVPKETRVGVASALLSGCGRTWPPTHYVHLSVPRWCRHHWELRQIQHQRSALHDDPTPTPCRHASRPC